MSECVIPIDDGYLFGDENRARASQRTFAAIKSLVHEIFHLRREQLPAGLHSLILENRLLIDLDLLNVDLTFVLTLLESSLGYVKLLFREYAGCQYEVIPGHEPFLRADRTLAGIAILKHSHWDSKNGLFDLNIVKAASAERLSHFIELTAQLNHLQTLGHIKVKPRNSLLIFRLDKTPAPGPDTEAVALWLYKQLLARYEAEDQGKRQIHDILFGDSCISAAIASHFGSQLPGGAVRCGRCSVCLDGAPVKAPHFTPKEVMLDEIKQVLDDIPVRDNPRLLARVAIGVHSPQIRVRRYHRKQAFRSMAECRFEVSPESSCRDHDADWNPADNHFLLNRTY